MKRKRPSWLVALAGVLSLGVLWSLFRPVAPLPYPEGPVPVAWNARPITHGELRQLKLTHPDLREHGFELVRMSLGRLPSGKTQFEGAELKLNRQIVVISEWREKATGHRAEFMLLPGAQGDEIIRYAAKQRGIEWDQPSAQFTYQRGGYGLQRATDGPLLRELGHISGEF